MNHNINNQIDKVIKELDLLEKLLNDNKIANLMSSDTNGFLPDTNSFLPDTNSFLPDTNSFLPDTNGFLPITQKKLNILLPMFSRISHKINDQTHKTHTSVSDSVKKSDSNKKTNKSILIKSYLDITHCYICKIKFSNNNVNHDKYNTMCQTCGDINYAKRIMIKDLTGKVAIVTGGRVKIGYETSLKLLKSGCTVICTSRFVDDCLERYMCEKDFPDFKSRLHIYQLNLSDYQSIDKFIKFVHSNFSHVDYLINNAAQTIKRPREFYQHLLDKIYQEKSLIQTENSQLIIYKNIDELKRLEFIPAKLMLNDMISDDMISDDMISDDMTSEKIVELFPVNNFDQFGQQIDLRTTNSWILEASDVNIQELADVYIINAIAPYILSTRLKSLMQSKDTYSYIINVTSMEGVFSWNSKPSTHPHTNMAKAALNMFTRTCGKYFIKQNTVLVCVDTGWNNSQYPNSYDIQTPIDCMDGAARILDPIFRNLIKHSVLYKDYIIHDF